MNPKRQRQRQAWSLLVFLILLLTSLTIIPASVSASPSSYSKLPEVSSTLLKTHRQFYLQQPPHDTSLYDCLHVSPNATAADITRQYRKVSRHLHPDKQGVRHQRKVVVDNDDNGDDDDDGDGNDENDKAAEQLQRVREAYEVLKDDSTRLPYHRYGLQNINQAAWILTGNTGLAGGNGNGNGNSNPLDADAGELLRLMGYDSDNDSMPPADADDLQSHEQEQEQERRVWFLAVNLLEKIRPLVEGAVTEATLADAVVRECDRLKCLPLGAQILRCIGRAYRYSGRQALRRSKSTSATVLAGNGNGNNGNSPYDTAGPGRMGKTLNLSDTLRERIRHAKHVWTATVASGRVVISETRLQSQQQRQQQQQQQQQQSKESLAAVGYHWDGGDLGALTSDGTHDDDVNVPTDEELKELERFKARNAVLESLQVEALWKIRKIELDRTIRQACDLILDGDYFFFPSHQSSRPADWQEGGDGWVGSSGKVIDARDGRLRAASALVMIGNIMVQRSKEGTSWME
jgi:curved DNA-binding protein CbpA